MHSSAPTQSRRHVRAAVLLALVCSCEDERLRASSAHYSLYVSDARWASGKVDTASLLSDLEETWADMATFFHTPDDARIAYHLWNRSEVSDQCDGAFACAFGTTIYADAKNDHELNHAYLSMLRGGSPLPLVAEGMANSVGCGFLHFSDPSYGDLVSWQDAVRSTPGNSNLPYDQGRLLMSHLVETDGIDETLAYYVQAPADRDPAKVAENFGSFWARELDADWAAAHTRAPGHLPMRMPKCPCSLPELTIDGTEHESTLGVGRYWPVGDLGTDALFISSSSMFTLRDCPGQTTSISTFRTMIARLRRPHFVSAVDYVAERGKYVEDDCLGAQAIDLASFSSGDEVAVVVEGTWAAPQTVYARFISDQPVHLTVDAQAAICADCSFGTGCELQPPGTVLNVGQGAVLQLRLYFQDTVTELVRLTVQR